MTAIAPAPPVRKRGLRKLASDLKRREPTVLRVELELEASDRILLRRVPIAIDPLNGIYAALEDLDPEEESARVKISILPIDGRKVRAVRVREERSRNKSMDRQRRGEGGGAMLAGALLGDNAQSMGMRRPRNTANTAVDPEKAVSLTGPMFDCQILLRVTSPDKRRANLIMDRLVGAFGAWSGNNRWVPRPSRSPAGFDALMDGIHLRRGKKRMWIPSDYIAPFFGPPTMRCPAANVLRLSSGSVPPPPPDLPRFSRQAKNAGDLLPWGYDTRRRRYVGAYLSESLFSWTGGKSGYGKTETSICRFLHVVEHGHGAMFVDPNADAVSKIKPYLDDVIDRVVEVSVASADKSPYQVGWNMFDVGHMDAADRGAAAEAVMNGIASALGWTADRATRALPMLNAATRSIAHLASLVPREICPTIFQIPTLLSNEDWVFALAPHLPHELRTYWEETFSKLDPNATTPITNLIFQLSSNMAVRALLGSSVKTYDFRDIMDTGKILLFRLGGTGPVDKLLASLAVYDMMRAMMSRRDIPPQERRPFYVWMDEVQSFAEAVEGSITQGIEEGRKYGLRMHLMNQEPSRLPADCLQAIYTNGSHLMFTAVGQQSARSLSDEMGGKLDTSAIVGIEKYHFVTKMTVNHKTLGPFGLKGLGVDQMFGPPEGKLSEEEREAAIRRASGAMKVTDILKTANQLDQKIYDHLIKLPPPSADPSEDASSEEEGERGPEFEEVPVTAGPVKGPDGFIPRPDFWN